MRGESKVREIEDACGSPFFWGGGDHAHEALWGLKSYTSASFLAFHDVCRVSGRDDDNPEMTDWVVGAAATRQFEQLDRHKCFKADGCQACRSVQMYN